MYCAGIIPSSLGSLSQLTHLNLSYNKLTRNIFVMCMLHLLRNVFLSSWISLALIVSYQYILWLMLINAIDDETCFLIHQEHCLVGVTSFLWLTHSNKVIILSWFIDQLLLLLMMMIDTCWCIYYLVTNALIYSLW